MALRVRPSVVGVLVAEPVGLSGHGAAGGEQPESRQALGLPVVDLGHGIRCQRIDRVNTHQPVWVRADGVYNITVVMAVNRGGLDHDGLGYTRVVHRAQYAGDIYRALARPVRLMAADGRLRILVSIPGDGM